MDRLFIAALLVGLSYWPGSEMALPPAALIAWKGAGVGLLALWAALRASDTDGWLLTLIMACGFAGDVLLEAVSLEAGAAAFLIGHLVAIVLYSRNRATPPRWAPLAFAPLVAICAALLPADTSAAPGVALYGLALGGMASCALMSRFRLAAVGAWLFVASDLLIFARLGPFPGGFLPGMLIWPLYFVGQAMIAWDVGRRPIAK